MAAPHLLASTASAVTIGKDGSNVNYLFELSRSVLYNGFIPGLAGKNLAGTRLAQPALGRAALVAGGSCPCLDYLPGR
jgi:hypothetical protein